MKNAFKQLLILLFATSLLIFTSCGKDEDDEMDDGSSETVSLEDVSLGSGKFVATGDENFSVEGLVVGANLTSTINGKDYAVNSVTISVTEGAVTRSVRLTFYIPASLGQTIPPNGTFEVDAPSAALDETFVDVSLVGENGAYNSFSSTTGSVTVSGSSVSNNMFNVVFDVGNVTSFDDLSADVQGALKF